MRVLLVVSLLLGAAVLIASFFVGKNGGVNVGGVVVGALVVLAALAMLPSLRRRRKI